MVAAARCLEAHLIYKVFKEYSATFYSRSPCNQPPPSSLRHDPFVREAKGTHFFSRQL